MVEVRWIFFSQSGHELPNLREWSTAYMNALSSMQKDPGIGIAGRLEHLLRWKGFEHAQEIIQRVPIGNWRPGSHLAQLVVEVQILTSFQKMTMTMIM
jgi:hypothetical protein